MPNTQGAVRALMAVPPGLEHCGAIGPLSPDAMQTLCRDNIRKDLELHLSPKDRDHRCDHQGSLHGAMSFAELATLIAEYWGCIDVFSRSVFEQLAQEGREVHAARVKEYEDHPRTIRLKKNVPMPISMEEKTEASAMAPIDPKKKISAKHSSAVLLHKPAEKAASVPQAVLVASREIMEPNRHIPIANRGLVHQGFTYTVSHIEDTASSASDASPSPVGEIGASVGAGRTNDMLMSRIQALEKSLEAGRYHARVREIEVELAKTRAREEELLSMLSNLTRPTTFSAGRYPPALAPQYNSVMQNGYASTTGYGYPSFSGARQHATASPRFAEHQSSYLPSTAFHYPAARGTALPSALNKKRRRWQATTPPNRFSEPELNFE